MTDHKKEKIHHAGAETFRAPESAPETLETHSPEQSEAAETAPQPTEVAKPHRAPLHRHHASPPPVRDPLTLKIEKILEENVGDAYQRLSPIARQEFKLKGEQTAIKIKELLKDTHVKVKKIFQLILEWLKLLPGVNRFFLEQEAKIKTDRILELYKRK